MNVLLVHAQDHLTQTEALRSRRPRRKGRSSPLQLCKAHRMPAPGPLEAHIEVDARFSQPCHPAREGQ